MSTRVRRGPVIALIVIVTALLIWGLKVGAQKGVLPGAKLIASLIPQSGALPSAAELKLGDVKKMSNPSSEPVASGTPISGMIWAWNSQFGLIDANGGPITTKGSAMEGEGLKLSLSREDNNDKMMAALVKGDVNFINVMGDGAPTAFIAPLAKEMAKLGPENKPVIVGTTGYSRGEDKFMGPKEWRDAPFKAKGGTFIGADGKEWGSVVVGVIRDGDWNIAQKWASDNKIKNNPDLKTWDRDAVNWMGVLSYTEAAEKYAAGAVEERDVVKDGKKTGEKIKVMVRGVVTWTPGDVICFEKKPGLVTIASTDIKQYGWQMPSVIIMNQKWAKANADTVVKLLAGIAKGGDQVKAFESARHFAGEASQAVYQEKGWTGADWEKYYIGVDKTDPVTHETIRLGGSSASNLADALQLFGLLPGQSEQSSIYRSVYNLFGNIAIEQYPNDVPKLVPYDEAVDLSFLKALAAMSKVDAKTAEVPKYGGDIKQTVSNRAWAITFATGSAKLTPAGERTMQQIYDSLNVTSLQVELAGHTDNVGNSDTNRKLSEARAFAVKAWLQAKSPSTFPDDRFPKVLAKGDSEPVQPNGTAAGRAANRRVEIRLGSN